MTERKNTPNMALRRVREIERQESRAEFAEAMAALARRLGEPITPAERYIARLEDGEVRYPSGPYRRVLAALCQRPITELGFTRRPSAAVAELAAAEPAQVPPGQSRSARVTGPPSLAAPAPEWPVWFAARTSQLVTMVDGWRDTADRLGSLQATLHAEALMFDAVAPDDPVDADVSHALSRRQALATLATLPLAINVTAGPTGEARPAGSFLARSAASLTACWHLMRGTDFGTVHQVISGYIVGLEGLAAQRSAYRATAARLAAQAHRILGIVALHRDRLEVRETHTKQAIFYATVAEDFDNQASSLMALADTYLYAGQPARFAAACERALGLGSNIAPLCMSRIHAGLAAVYAQLGREEDALREMGRSEEVYPDYPEQDRSYMYAEFSPASLALWHGIAHLELAKVDPSGDYPRKAADAFVNFTRRSPGAPDRIKYEIINHQAVAAVQLNDLDAFESHMSDAIAGVSALASRQRRREALQAWQLATQRWPDEPRLRSLSEGVRLVSADGPGTAS